MKGSETHSSCVRVNTERTRAFTCFNFILFVFSFDGVKLRSLAVPDAVPAASTASRHVGGICTLSSARDGIRANKLMRAISFVTVNN